MVDVIKYMEAHVRTVLNELEIMEQEYLLLKMIVLFQMREFPIFRKDLGQGSGEGCILSNDFWNNLLSRSCTSLFTRDVSET